MALLIGAAVPLTISAQQASIPTVDLLDGSVATAGKALLFDEGLKVEGFIRNHNVGVEVHSADGDYARLPALAADLIHRDVGLVAALDTPSALAIKAIAKDIPIVFAVESDPIQTGLVATMDRPGANITGATDMAVEQERERLKLLHDLLPKATLFAFLVNPANPNARAQTENMLATGHDLGVQINTPHARDESDLERVLAPSADWRADGFVIGDDDFFMSRGARLAALTARRALPAVFAHRGFAAAGGQAGVYSVLVLKGGRPADLTVFQTRQTELIVNLKTAHTLGLAVSSDLLERATEVIK